MRIIAISDTHGKHHEVELPPYRDGDILVHAGDITRKGEIATVANFGKWLEHLPYEHKIVIAGNHDFSFQDERRVHVEAILRSSSATYLYDDSVTIQGVKFYGSPWQPWFHSWAFNLQRGPEIARKWEMIPYDTDVLITHGPPGNNNGGLIQEVISGVVHENETGCADLLKRVQTLRQLQWHIFGHIHECYGTYQDPGATCRFVNASVLNIKYKCVNKPFVLGILPKL